MLVLLVPLVRLLLRSEWLRRWRHDREAGVAKSLRRLRGVEEVEVVAAVIAAAVCARGEGVVDETHGTGVGLIAAVGAEAAAGAAATEHAPPAQAEGVVVVVGRQ